MVGANMYETEKFKLFIIGNANKFRCLKRIKSLPVDYK